MVSRGCLLARGSASADEKNMKTPKDIAATRAQPFEVRIDDGHVSSPPLALERLFIATPLAEGIVAGQWITPEVAGARSSNRPLSRQLFQQRLRFLQIARVKPFSEPPVHRRQ
jgi:hypothetical protein